jgi:hypothetical protein
LALGSVRANDLDFREAEMAQHIDTLTAWRVVFSVCLTISSAVALPAWGEDLMSSSYPCTLAQIHSPEGSKCIDQMEKDIQNSAPKRHVFYCKGSDLVCCLNDTTKPHGLLSDCKVVGQMPPSGAPSGTPSCKSQDEDYLKALQVQTRAEKAWKDLTSQAKEEQIKATKDQKQIDAWKDKVKAAGMADNNAVKDAGKAHSALEKCLNDPLFKTRK